MKTIKSVKLNYVFYFLFLHLCHIVCFQFTVQRLYFIYNLINSGLYLWNIFFDSQ